MLTRSSRSRKRNSKDPQDEDKEKTSNRNIDKSKSVSVFPRILGSKQTSRVGFNLKFYCISSFSDLFLKGNEYT